KVLRRTRLGRRVNAGADLCRRARRTTLFFSFEAIQQGLRQPTPADFFSTLMSWTRQGHGNQEGPIERNYRWGNGLGFDGYAYPGSRQPLWGY
ncbi:MAG: hypothetical protein AB1671_14990, partial [Thermodesulfobacteriota bacterium]